MKRFKAAFTEDEAYYPIEMLDYKDDDVTYMTIDEAEQLISVLSEAIEIAKAREADNGTHS